MADQASLSDLCGICYTQKPKYRCPGCKAQTCSLPCYKRHQQRASCTGKRDPAVFVKRSQLATPTGIDQDYNYLKSVERSIEHASRETSERGVGGKSNAKGSDRGLHPESLLQRYFSANRICIERAPKGMSRQKTNQTRFTKRQNVLWTVEWIDDEGTRVVQADCLASSSLQESYELALNQKRNASTRALTVDHSASSTTKRKKLHQNDARATKSLKLQADTEDQCKYAEKPRNPVRQTSAPQTECSAVSQVPPEPNADAHIPEMTTVVGQPAESDCSACSSFYLLKPGTTSSSKVLIPLDSQATLTDSLRDQTVLEYPTLYVLPQSPGSLPPQYLLEKDYIRIRKDEEEELNDAIKQAGPAAADQSMRHHDAAAATNVQIDPQKILDMLKRDVTR